MGAGAHAVSLAHVVGPFFITNPEEMFSLDRFHPSSLGYKRTAQALLPQYVSTVGPMGLPLPLRPTPQTCLRRPGPAGPPGSGSAAATPASG